jgi:hypothetical protein
MRKSSVSSTLKKPNPGDLCHLPSSASTAYKVIMQDTTNLRGTYPARNDNDCTVCHITEVEATFDSSDSSSHSVQYACHYDSGLGFRDTLDATLPQSALDQYRTTIQSGTAHFCIPNKYKVGRAFVVPADSQLELLQRRNLLSHKDFTIGTKRVLAVRVTSSSGEEPDETVEEIGQAVFGTNWDPSTLAQPSATVFQQYQAVSHGQLQLVQAKGNNISNGILQVKLNETIAGKEIQRDLISGILAATQAAVGVDLSKVAEHFIFCIPNSSLLDGTDTWTAFTYLFEPVSIDCLCCTALPPLLSLTQISLCSPRPQYSYYQQSRCTKLSVVMHEFGHSLGFRHSGYAGNEYADTSGYMVRITEFLFVAIFQSTLCSHLYRNSVLIQFVNRDMQKSKCRVGWVHVEGIDCKRHRTNLCSLCFNFM